MKNILITLSFLMFVFTTNAQKNWHSVSAPRDTAKIDSSKIIKQYLDGLIGNKIPNSSNLYVNYFDNFSYYQNKSAKCFILSGVSLGITALIGITPTLVKISNPETDIEVISQVCAIGAGVGFISTVVCLIRGGIYLHKSSLILDQQKRFIIETNGTNIRIRF